MKRAILLAAAVAVAVCAPGAVAGGKASTTVTLDSMFEASGSTIITGSVKSPRKGCRNNRRVAVFRVIDGPDEKVGSASAFGGEGNTASYAVYGEDEPDGDYYAKAKPTERCKGDRSPNYTYDAP